MHVFEKHHHCSRVRNVSAAAAAITAVAILTKSSSLLFSEAPSLQALQNAFRCDTRQRQAIVRRVRLQEVNAVESLVLDAPANQRIFVCIAAFCDPELPETLRAMLHKASHPELVFVGLVWQGFDSPLSDADLAKLSELWGVPNEGASRYANQAIENIFAEDGSLKLPAGKNISCSKLAGGHIKVLHMHAEDARGPCWARYLGQHLWDGEGYYLQIDSHMRFSDNWDDLMHEELTLCSEYSRKPVLSNYGRSYELGIPFDWDPPAAKRTPGLISAEMFDSNGLLNIRSAPLKENWAAPHRNYFWSGHFSFSSSRIILEVPYDPQCLGLLIGEEPLMAVRLFTHGWDIFSPTQNIVYHLWTRSYRRKAPGHNPKTDISPETMRRVRQLLGMSSETPHSSEQQQQPWPLPGRPGVAGDCDPFGLGSERSLANYETAADVSFKHRSIGSKALRGHAPSMEYYKGIAPSSQQEDENPTSLVLALVVICLCLLVFKFPH